MATTIPVQHVPHGAPIGGGTIAGGGFQSGGISRGPLATTQQSPALAPAGTLEQAVTKTPDELSPELQVLVDTINRLYHARTIDEHKAILKSFDDDVVVDTPLIYTTGKDRLRVLATLLKTAIGHFDMRPKVLRIRMLEDKRAQVEIDNSLHVQPWRSWLFPPSLLLPRDIPLHNTITLGVKSHNDKIGLFKGRIHNIPPLPFLARFATGWGVGTAGTLLEPVYFQLMDWYRSAYDNISGTTANIKESARDTVDRAKDTVSSTTEAVRERVQPIVERAAETVGLKSD